MEIEEYKVSSHYKMIPCQICMYTSNKNSKKIYAPILCPCPSICPYRYNFSQLSIEL